MGRFIKLQRMEDSEELRHLLRSDHNAFILLTIIANRARRSKEPNPINGTKQFQALIGDYKNCGLSERNYRTAKEHLEKYGLATFNPTPQGTIATLCNGKVYDINPDEADEQPDRQPTDSRQTGDEQATTKKNVRMQEGEECKNNPSCPEPPSADSEPETVLVFPIKGGGEYGLPRSKLNQYVDTFTDLGEAGVLAELKRARQWLRDNPKRLKLTKGMPKFMNLWLSGNQNQKGGRTNANTNRNQKRPSQKANDIGRASGEGLPVLKFD